KTPIYSQLITFTATVTSGGTPVTNGTVTFQAGSTILAAGQVLDDFGQANFDILSLAAGTHTITASYNRTVGLLGRLGSVSRFVIPDRRATVLYTLAPAVSFREPSVLSADVTPFLSAYETQTGSVVFFDRGTPLATVALSTRTAVFTASTLPLGKHSLTA